MNMLPPSAISKILIASAILSLAACHQEKQQAHMPGVATRASAVPLPASRGMEMYWWGFDDGGDSAALARKLQEYISNSVPLSENTRHDWTRNGLRMVSIPRENIPALELALRVNGVQRKSMGEVSDWATLAAGPPWTGRQQLQMSEGELVLEAGRLRLIARAWTSPDILEGRNGEPGILRYVTRVEMAIQHEERDERPRELFREHTDLRGIHDAGLVLSRTIANFDVWPNEAVLIFPEPPDADLPSLATSRPEPPVATAEAGPEIPRMPTAGELLLAGRPLGKGPARRAIIVLMNAKSTAPDEPK